MVLISSLHMKGFWWWMLLLSVCCPESLCGHSSSHLLPEIDLHKILYLLYLFLGIVLCLYHWTSCMHHLWWCFWPDHTTSGKFGSRSNQFLLMLILSVTYTLLLFLVRIWWGNSIYLGMIAAPFYPLELTFLPMPVAYTGVFLLHLSMLFAQRMVY